MAETLNPSMHLARPSQTSLGSLWDLTADEDEVSQDSSDLLKNFQSSQSTGAQYDCLTESRISSPSTRVCSGLEPLGYKAGIPPLPPLMPTSRNVIETSQEPVRSPHVSVFPQELPSISPLPVEQASHPVVDLSNSSLAVPTPSLLQCTKPSLISFFDDGDDVIQDEADFFEVEVQKLPKTPRNTRKHVTHSRRSIQLSGSLAEFYSSTPPFPFTPVGSLHSAPYDEHQDAKIIELKEIRGCSLDEIATATGRSYQSISTRYSTNLRLGCSKSYRNQAVKLLHDHGFTRVPFQEEELSNFSRSRRSRRPFSRLPLHRDGMVPTPNFDFDDIFQEIEEQKPVEEPESEFMQYYYARASRTTSERPGQVPYLSLHERQTLSTGFLGGTWHSIPHANSRLHIGFSESEIFAVIRNIRQFLGQSSSSPILPLFEYAIQLTEAGIRIVSQLCCEDGDLQKRSRYSIEAFLYDSKIKPPPREVEVITLKGTVGREDDQDEMSLLEHLRNRELGLGLPGQCRMSHSFENAAFDTLGPVKSFVGTSGAVMSVAWAPGESTFAVGSVSPIDSDSLQYNCPLNLLIGDADTGVLFEKDEHHISRPRPATGPNSTHEMYASQDPRVYTTVSGVGFSPNGEWLYSGGYDNKLRLWSREDVSQPPRLKFACNLKAPIEILDVHQTTGVVAVASRQINRSVRLIHLSHSECKLGDAFHSSRAVERPEADIYPSALRWGVHPWDQHLLAGGFTSNTDIESVDLQGDLCVWDANVGARVRLSSTSHSVFDCAWSPFGNKLAIGAASYSSGNRSSRSVVKIFEMSDDDRMRSALDLECQAYDMNMLQFCQYDENIVSAGCTDGRVYVWDIRRPESYLHVLEHDEPITPLAPGVKREYIDTGVGFVSWGKNRSRLYTGSSDGVVKSWDIYRARENAFVHDVAHFSSAVMTASFSDDYSRMIVGEDAGGICVLEIGNQGRSCKSAARFDLVRAPAEGARLSSLGELEGSMEDLHADCSLLERSDSSSDVSVYQHHNVDDKEEANMASEHSDVLEARSQQKSQTKPSVFFTPDDITDSGRSLERLPFALLSSTRLQNARRPTGGITFGSTSSARIPRPPCVRCGNRPARVYISDRQLSEECADSGGAVNQFKKDSSPTSSSTFDPASPSARHIPARLLCELCDFDCFYCGRPARVDISGQRVITCEECGNAWKIGCLGYRHADAPDVQLKPINDGASHLTQPTIISHVSGNRNGPSAPESGRDGGNGAPRATSDERRTEGVADAQFGDATSVDGQEAVNSESKLGSGSESEVDLSLISESDPMVLTERRLEHKEKLFVQDTEDDNTSFDYGLEDDDDDEDNDDDDEEEEEEEDSDEDDVLGSNYITPTKAPNQTSVSKAKKSWGSLHSASSSAEFGPDRQRQLVQRRDVSGGDYSSGGVKGVAGRRSDAGCDRTGTGADGDDTDVEVESDLAAYAHSLWGTV